MAQSAVQEDTGEVQEVAEPACPDKLRRALWSACRKGCVESAIILIEHGAELTYTNSFGRTLLMMSTYAQLVPETKRLNLVKLLVERGANPYAEDSENKTVLHYAVEFSRPLVAAWLAPIFDETILSEAFMLALVHDNLVIARMLLDRGANVNYVSDNGVRPIIVATNRQSCEMLAFLANRGADVNAAARTGAAAIHFAARRSVTVLLQLLQKGANLHARTNMGNTALHYAVDVLNVENVALLLQYGADVNAGNQTGDTPLLGACRKANFKMVELLLAHGADPNLSDEVASHPVNQVVLNPSFHSCELLDLLLRSGARINPETGTHPLALLCSANKALPFSLVHALIERGACLPASGWLPYVTYPPTLLKLGVWAHSHKAAAVAFLCTFVYGEEKGVRPVPVPRRLTGAYGLYPIRRRLAGYLVCRKNARYMIEELIKHFL